MLIRDTNGNIISIKRSDFITDSDYYRQISLFYGVNLNKLNNSSVSYMKTANNFNYIINAKTTRDKILDCIKNM